MSNVLKPNTKNRSINKNIEHNKEMVDQYLLEKKITLAEAVTMDGGVEFLEFLISEGIACDFADAPFEKHREPSCNREVFPMIYMMNIISGNWSVRRTQTILKNEALLRILGFNEEQIAGGLTQRGKKNQYGEGYER